MAKINYLSTNFTAGEFSPQLFGRTDIAKYFNGCAKLENFYIKSFGGAFRRPGTYYVAEVKTSSKATRIIPFQFSTTQAYIIEVGDQYMRFYKDGGQIVQGTAVEISTPYLEADIFELQFAQSADTMYIVHKDYAPRKLTRSSHVTWTLTAIDFEDGPYLPSNTTTTTITPSATTGSIAITSSTDIFFEDGPDLDYYNILTIHFDGNDGVTSYTAETGQTVTFIGTAQLDTAQKKFGTASLLLDGDSDYVTLPDSDDWDFGSGDFTIDFQVRFNTVTGKDYYLINQYGIAGHRSWVIEIGFGNLYFSYSIDGSLVLSPSVAWVPSTSTWYHIEIIRNGADLKFFVDGVQQGATQDMSTITIFASDSVLQIGYYTADYFDGWVDEIRISKGIARHTADFTAPTVQYAVADVPQDLIGSLMQIGGSGHYVKITSISSISTASATVQSALINTSATTNWAKGAWSGENGYPAAVTFHEERLFFAGSKEEPQTVWGSVSSDFENMLAGAAAGDALIYTIADNLVNAIRWLVSTKVLSIGTIGGGFNLSSGSDSSPLTPTNVQVKRETSYGSAEILPKRIGNYIYYIQRNNRTMREFAYDINTDTFLALDITLLAEHITESGIVDMDYQESPDNILWCVRDDGDIACLTRQIDQEVIGWFKVITNGDFESVAIIPNGEEDEVWVVVKRTINGSAVRYIEYFKPFSLPAAQDDLFFVDCGLTYSGSAAQIMSGLSHLQSAGVVVLADGAVHPTRTVSGGSITLNNSYSVVHVGLAYTSKLKSLKLETGMQTGTAQGHIKRIYQSIVRLFKSIGFDVHGANDTYWTPAGFILGRVQDDEWVTIGETTGTDEKTDEALFNNTQIAIAQEPKCFTGDKLMQYPAGFDKEAQVYIEISDPLPLNILSIVSKIEISEE